jgi:hypothetical protein
MWNFLSEPTDAQVDHSIVEYEHQHLEFLHAFRGMLQTGPVPAQPQQEVSEIKMDGHHLQVRRAHSQ